MKSAVLNKIRISQKTTDLFLLNQHSVWIKEEKHE